MQNTVKFILKNMVVIFVCLLFAILLAFLSYKIPQRPVEYHVEVSSYLLQDEGMYRMLIEGEDGTTLDNFSDAIMISEALVQPPEGEIMKYAMMSYYYFIPGAPPQEALPAYFAHSNDLHLIGYGRYWHGYLFPLKLLLTRFSLQNIRFLNIACQILLIFLVLYLMAKKSQMSLFFPLCIATVCLFPIAITLSLHYSPLFYLAYGAIAVMLLFKDRIDRIYGGWYTFFLINGILTVYYDLFSFPLITLGFPLCVLLCMDDGKTKTTKQKWAALIGCSAHWGLGYGGFWVLKWIVGTILSGEDIWSDAINSFTIRSSQAYGSISLNAGKVLERTMSIVNINLAVRYMVIIYLLVILGIGIRRLYQGELVLKVIFISAIRWIPLLICTVMPAVWYAVTQNHSYQHAWFTYRILAVSYLAGTCFCLKLIEPIDGFITNSKKQ